jgi:hypothetical protein
MTDATPSHPWKRHLRAGRRQRLPRLTDPAERVVVVTAPAWSPAPPLDLPAWCHLAGCDCLGPVASPLGPAYAIRLAAVTKLGNERWP